jgi:hypothetical protein
LLLLLPQFPRLPGLATTRGCRGTKVKDLKRH